MLSQQQPPRFAQYGAPGPRRSNEWRGPATNSYNMPSPPRYQNAGSAFSGHSQAFGQNYDMDAYRIQQAQMSIQLESMKLQNIEMQERLMAAVQQQHMQQNYGVAAPVAHNYVDPRGQYHAAQAQPKQQQDDYIREQSRREAIAAAQRGHLRRSPSPEPQAFEQQQQQQSKRANRLSFNGANGEQLAERAMARKHSSGTQSRPTSGDFAATVAEMRLAQAQQQAAAAAAAQGHTRGQASVSSTCSGQSIILSDERRELFSPHGPTIFLSSPGETYPAVHSNSASDEDSALSSGSDSPTLDSGASSVTSLASSQGSNDKSLDMSALGRRLNPAASTFTPTPTAPQQPEQRMKQQQQQRPTSRVFSGPAVKSLTYVTRQPRGPVQEDELPAENFKGRQRKQALSKLKRRSFTPAA